jgi:hypothetical protein
MKNKGINKLKVGFSIDIKTNDMLNEYCEKHSINKSKLINVLIIKFLNKEKEK